MINFDLEIDDKLQAVIAITGMIFLASRMPHGTFSEYYPIDFIVLGVSIAFVFIFITNRFERYRIK